MNPSLAISKEGTTAAKWKRTPLAMPLVLAMPLAIMPAPMTRAEPVTAEKVRNAISRGADYLLREQGPRGNWSDMGDYPGGVSGLCALALLNAGVEPSDPKIQKALGYLRKIKSSKTYSVALQTMALCAAEPRADMVRIQANVDWLEKHQITVEKRSGSWAYPKGVGDNSNSQFAVLALHEAERVGAQVEMATWRRAADYWRRNQRADGSWGYQPGHRGTGSMTCAGIGAMVICSGKVTPPDATVDGARYRCCQPQEENDSIDRALAWLGRNFSVNSNPGFLGMGHQWLYYYLYGVERVGRLTARRLLGKHDWYREGAEFLVNKQDTFTGKWTGSGHAETNSHITTALALLFLSKGRRPILLSKLQHGPGEDWNNHRNDVVHLTALAEKLWGFDMTWQISDPRQASVDDLLQSPVLFLSGSRDPGLEDQAKKFRDYLDRGGFLFAEGCCTDSNQFEKGFRKLIDRMFPEQEYHLRRVGPEHPIWRVERLVRPESPYAGRLWSVEYGCRTCVVYCESDLSCFWELSGRETLRGLPEDVSQRIADATAIGVNVLAYATGRQPKGKEAAFAGGDDPLLEEAVGERGVIRIAKLQHAGGCNDAPGALVNLLRSAARGELKLRMSKAEFPLAISDQRLLRFHMAFMHGRHDFRLTPKERLVLRQFLENGGTLLADSICASRPFTAAFRREIGGLFPGQPLQRIPATHPMFTEACGGYEIRQVQLRDPVQQQAGDSLHTRERKVAPELEGIELSGRMAVIFSPYDLSCALEQHESLQCRGYTRKDAARIGLNALVYSLNPDVGE